MTRKGKTTSFFWLSCAVFLGVACIRAFIKGAPDFKVFYHAWNLVGTGRGSEIYRNSPDRFLYAPGFAWILSPLGLLPFSLAVGLWCLAKSLLLVSSIRQLSIKLFPGAFWGTFLVARPLLIDFEYGQVNLVLLCSLILAWSSFTSGTTGTPSWVSPFRKARLHLEFSLWMLASSLSFSKLFCLPLVLLPFLPASLLPASSIQIRIARLGVLAGGILTLAVPLFSLGFARGTLLYSEWLGALLSKGLPLETHNQSFVGFLHRWLGGAQVHALSEGSQVFHLGIPVLSSRTITLLGTGWSLIWMGIILGWLLVSNRHPRSFWIAVAAALLILPSHLIWKPYFLFGLPLALYFCHQILQSRLRIRPLFMGLVLFFGVNLTGFDWVGHALGVRLESASFLLVMHFLLLGSVFRLQKESFS